MFHLWLIFSRSAFTLDFRKEVQSESERLDAPTGLSLASSLASGLAFRGLVSFGCS